MVLRRDGDWLSVRRSRRMNDLRIRTGDGRWIRVGLALRSPAPSGTEVVLDGQVRKRTISAFGLGALYLIRYDPTGGLR